MYKFLITIAISSLIGGMWVQYRITGTIYENKTIEQIKEEAGDTAVAKYKTEHADYEKHRDEIVKHFCFEKSWKGIEPINRYRVIVEAGRTEIVKKECEKFYK